MKEGSLFCFVVMRFTESGSGGGFLVRGGTGVRFGVPWSCSPWNPWHPPWYPPLAPATPMAPSSRKALSYPIYSTRTNPNVHVQMF
jgi:hypothetical protein